MAERIELAKATVELASMMKELQIQMERMENRLDMVEGRLSSGASESKTADIWAAPKQDSGVMTAFGGVSVSGTQGPASVMLARGEMLLAPADEQIVNIIRTKGVVCATDVQAHFKYKGTNAASARLNRLASLGVLEKQQAGRKVYYKIK
ncbi:MAG: hypothetical protein WC492_01940 [Candidatus Micrarchaeia archaeon]